MARNKRPALTSPWKIGFLASLLPVAVGIGVGYSITRSFGLAWTWLEFHGTWSNWTFHREPFMTEMLPLAVLVPVLSLLSYLLITNAVRRYRTYVDSGLDYKILVKSIRQIDDLDNEKQIKKLGNHPELRDFLLGVRRTAAERTDALDAREAALAQREEKTSGGETLAAETDAVVSAIINAKNGGFQDELAVETPELRRVVKALRERLAEDAADADDEARWTELRDSLAASTDSLATKVAELREEIVSSLHGARELESEIGHFRDRLPDVLGTTAGTGGDDAGARRAISQLDNIAQTLQALGEETRTVAINTALQAGSGDGSGESVVQLADDVREVAARFNGIAQQWEEASALARRSLGGATPPQHKRKDNDVVDAIDAISSRVGLWVERSVILSEKMKSFDQHYRDAVSALTATLSGEVDAGEWSSLPETAAPGVVSAGFNDGEEFERQGDANDRLIGDEGAGVEAGGFERQEGVFKRSGSDGVMFADIPGGVPTNNAEEGAAHFAEKPIERTARTRSDDPAPRVDDAPSLAGVRREEPTVDAEPGEVEADDGFTHGSGYPRATSATAAERRSAAPRFATSSHIEEIDSIPSVEDDAVSLYELGAVDYEPENAYHNA